MENKIKYEITHNKISYLAGAIAARRIQIP